ncbi:MAG: hypothetical protein U0360_02155 [Dehalococcoidia bacterium]
MITSIALGTNALYAFRLAEGRALLVDAGPDLEGSWDELVAQLRAAGVAPREVRIVLILARARRSARLASRWAAEGARVLAGGADLDALRAGAEYAATRAAREAELRRHGCRRRPRGDRGAASRWVPLARCPGRRGGRRRDVVRPRWWGAAPGAGDAGTHTRDLVIAVERTGAALEHARGDTLLPDTIPTPELRPARARWAPRWPRYHRS